MPRLAPHVSTVPPSGIRRIFLLASELDDVISLVVGEPDQPVAPHIAAAAMDAWKRDDTDYTANGGITPLRRAIVDKLARENDMVVDLEQVWVTIGATQALHQVLHLLLAAGDEVLVPDPGYTTFSMTPAMLDAVAVPYRLHADTGFLPRLDELDQLVTPSTRAIIVNSPSNPLGTVFPAEMLRGLLDFARRHDPWVISDEVYEFFSWREPHVSMASLDGDERVFSVFSLSKTYAMTGVRVGYLVTPKGLADTMRSVQEAAISCVATPDQYAAIAAIEGSQQSVHVARDHYRQNLDAATALLRDRGIRYLEPSGTFYLWIDVGYAAAGDVAAWAERFLLEQRVAVAPGSAFGRSGEGWIRVCAAHEQAELLEGLGRLPLP